LLIPRAGEPVLLCPSPHYADPSKAGTTVLPASTLAIEDDDVRVVLPRGFFLTSEAVCSGFPATVLAHLAQRRVLHCVAVDPTGAFIAEWNALAGGVTAESLAPGGLPRAVGLIRQGIFAAACSRDAQSGGPTDKPQLVSPAASALFFTLSDVVFPPTPPAGGFYGSIAVPLSPPEGARAELASRLERACARLRNVVLNGRSDGDVLMAWRERCGIRILWAETARPAGGTVSGHLPLGYNLPPPCGWDASIRTIYLAPTLPAALDAAYLGAILSVAAGMLSGRSVLQALVVDVMTPPEARSRRLTSASFGSLLCREAALSSLLLASIASATQAEAALRSLPWGPGLLNLLPPPSASGPAYDQLFGEAVERAARDIITPVLTPSIDEAYLAALSIGDQWFAAGRDLGQMAALPAFSGQTGSFAGSEDTLPAEELTDHLPSCRDLRLAFTATGPALLYAWPSHSELAEPARVAMSDNGAVGALTLRRRDGAQIRLDGIPAADLAAIVKCGYIDLACLDGDQTLHASARTQVQFA
jgi:hypothetical protein